MKNKIVPIRFSEEDYNFLIEKSKKLRLSVSSLIRMVVLQKLKEDEKMS